MKQESFIRRALAIAAGALGVAFVATAIASPPPAKLDSSPPAKELLVQHQDTGQATVATASINYDKIVADQAIAEPRELDTSPPAVAILAHKIVDTTPAANGNATIPARLRELDTGQSLAAAALVDSLGAEHTGLDTGQQVNVTFSGYRTLVRSA